MVPPKGIPHPLISYGGSNLVVSLVAVGIVLSLTRTPTEEPGERGA
jgi:cell division protein FtsW